MDVASMSFTESRRGDGRGLWDVCDCWYGSSGRARGTRADLVVGFPGLVLAGPADGAGAVADGEGGALVGEEDAVPDVSAAGDRAQRRRAVEAAVDPLAPVAAPLPLHVRLIRP